MLTQRSGSIDPKDDLSRGKTTRHAPPGVGAIAGALLALAMAAGNAGAVSLPGVSKTLVGNLDETSSDTLIVGDVGNYEYQSVAVRFNTGNAHGRGFQLDKLRLKTSTNPDHSGRTPQVALKILNQGTNAVTPGTTPVVYFVPRRVQNGDMTFEAIGNTLAANKTYWLHISASQAYTSFRVHLTSSTDEEGESDWSIDDSTRSTTGAFWPDWSASNHGTTKSVQFEITGIKTTRANLRITGPDTISEGHNGEYTFQLSQKVGEAVVITYSTKVGSGDTATTDDFGVLTEQTITIPANQQSVDGITLSAPDDDIDETNEYFSLSIDSITPSGKVTPPSGNRKRIRIEDNDTATVRLVGQNQTVAEGDDATFTLQLDRPTSRDFAVPIRVETNATVDYGWTVPSQVTFAAGETSKTFTVEIEEDGNVESPESLTIGVGEDTIPKGVASVRERSLIVTIPGNLTRTRLTAGLPEGNFNYSYAEENAEAFFEIVLDRVSTATIYIDYHTLDITAKSPADYNVPAGRATFPPGTTSVKVPVNIVNDDLVEGTERFRVILSPGTSSDPGLEIDLAPSQGQITILDSDQATIYIRDGYTYRPTGNIVYEDQGHAPLTPELTEEVDYDFTVVLQTRETHVSSHTLFKPPAYARTGQDFNEFSETIRFNPHQIARELQVELIDDDIPEFIEFFSLTMMRNGIQEDLLTGETVIYYVIHDDDPLFMVEDTNTRSVNLTEPKGTGQRETTYVDIAIQSPMRETVSVDWALEEIGASDNADQPSRAVSDTHFVALSGTARFAPGELRHRIPITLIGDGKAGWTRQFNLKLSNPSAGAIQAPSGYRIATLAHTHRYRVRIADVDGPAVPTIVAPRTVVEGNDLTYHINLDPPTESEVKCRVTTSFSDGQAGRGDFDSIGALSTLLISPSTINSTSTTFSVHTDSDAEPPELFTLRAACEPNEASTLGRGEPVDTAIRTHGVTIYDADPEASPAGIIATTSNGEKVLQQLLKLPEGAPGEDIVIALKRPPTGYVRLGFRPVGADPDIIISGNRSHTFTAENWDEPYIISVSAQEDADNTNGDTELDLSFRTNSAEYASAGSFGQRRIWLREDDNDSGQGTVNHITSVHGAPSDGVSIISAPSESRHDGSTDSIIEMHFDKPLHVSYRTMKNHAWEVDGGWIRRAQRIDGSNASWRFWAKPHGKGQMSLWFNPETDCTAETAICSRDPARPIKQRLLLAIPGPGTTPGDFSKTHLGRPVFNLYAGPATLVDERRTEHRVNESDGGITFTITATPGPISGTAEVKLSTYEGTARHGHDIAQAIGHVVTFQQNQTIRTLNLAIVQDDTDEGEETFIARIHDPVSGTLGHNTAATGIIVNDGPMPKAWIARFGRTTAEHASEAITTRMEEPRGGRSNFTVAGIPSREGPEGEDSPIEPWDEDRLATTRTLTPEEVLGGTSFHFETNGGPMDRSFAAWGSVTQGGFDGEEDGHSVTGTVTTFVAGADTAYQKWTLGLGVAHSEGQGAFGSEIEVDTATLTSVHPYAAWDATDTTRLWGVLGYGAGKLRWNENASSETTRYNTDLTSTMAAAGAAKDLLRRENANGLDLTAKADVLWTQTESEARTGLEAARAKTGRIRGLIEASATFDALTGTIDTGVRHDSGDAEQGLGIEIGAGVTYERTPLKIDVKGRAIVAHEDSDFQTWSLAGRVGWKTGPTGLRLGVEPQIGDNLSGGTLWNDGFVARSVSGSGTEPAPARVVFNVGYAMRGSGYPGLLTPFAEMKLNASEEGRRRYGLEWTPKRDTRVQLSVENASDGAVRLTAGHRW